MVVGERRAAEQRRPRLQMKVDVVTEPQSSGQVSPGGKEQRAPARFGAFVDEALDSLRVEGDSVGEHAVFDDIDHRIGWIMVQRRRLWVSAAWSQASAMRRAPACVG